MAVPVTSYAAEWQMAIILAASAFLLMFQAQPVSRRRIIAAVFIVALAVGCSVVFADGQTPVYNICKDLEPWSAPWIFYGCWGLPDGK